MNKIKRPRGRPPKSKWMHDLVGIETLKPINKGKDPKALAIELRNMIEGEDEIPPKESTLVKWIGKIRNHPKSLLDGQWSVGCLAQYEIPAEALPSVMHIYKQRLRTEEYSITIREVLWIARLHALIDNPLDLERFARAYASRDAIDWLLENTVYTRDFDITLIGYLYADNPTTRAAVSKFGLHFLPTWGNDEEAELENKLKAKGYTLHPSPDQETKKKEGAK